MGGVRGEPLPTYLEEYWNDWPRFQVDWDRWARVYNRAFDLQKYYSWYGVAEESWEGWFAKLYWTMAEALELERCIEPDPDPEVETWIHQSGEAEVVRYVEDYTRLRSFLDAEQANGNIEFIGSGEERLIRPIDFVNWRVAQHGLGPAPKAFIRNAGSGIVESIREDQEQNAVRRGLLFGSALWCIFHYPDECKYRESWSGTRIARAIVSHREEMWPDGGFQLYNVQHAGRLLNQLMRNTNANGTLLHGVSNTA